jgi:hypothetical protein
MTNYRVRASNEPLTGHGRCDPARAPRASACSLALKDARQRVFVGRQRWERGHRSRSGATSRSASGIIGRDGCRHGLQPCPSARSAAGRRSVNFSQQPGENLDPVQQPATNFLQVDRHSMITSADRCARCRDQGSCIDARWPATRDWPTPRRARRGLVSTAVPSGSQVPLAGVPGPRLVCP